MRNVLVEKCHGGGGGMLLLSLSCLWQRVTGQSSVSCLFSAYCMMLYARHWLMDAVIIQMYFPTGFEYQRIVLLVPL